MVLTNLTQGGTDKVRVLIGDREARLLAASPRLYIIESPRDIVGKTTLKVQRGNEVVAEGKFKNERVHSVNPWPYIILAVIIVGVVVVVAAASLVPFYLPSYGE